MERRGREGEIGGEYREGKGNGGERSRWHGGGVEGRGGRRKRKEKEEDRVKMIQGSHSTSLSFFNRAGMPSVLCKNR